jgi:hypothetical protein
MFYMTRYFGQDNTFIVSLVHNESYHNTLRRSS